MKPHEGRVLALLVDLCLWAIVIGVALTVVRAVKQDAVREFAAREVQVVTRYDTSEAVAPPSIADSARAKLLRRVIMEKVK